MQERGISPALGFQIAFLVFAVVFLNAPLERFILDQWEWAKDLDIPLGRPAIIASGGLLLLLIPMLRRRCAALLAIPIPRGAAHEVITALFLNYLAAMGALGVLALWTWGIGGEPALARRMGEGDADHTELARALSPGGIIFFIFVAGLLAPVVEELVFRGLLFSAWKNAWGWLRAAFASSLVFGLFHGLVIPQMLGGLVFVAAMRRTGSLRASIYAHALFNLSLWYPLLGQFALPRDRSTGELWVWTPHLVCFGLALAVLPWYLWSARDSRIPAPEDFEQRRLFC
jgi:membrane protease YdiL (CAAX protease family)